jgi:hypothetical protein
MLVHNEDAMQLMDARGGELVCDALRRSSSITSLTLIHTRMWLDMDVGFALLRALTGHVSIATLNLEGQHVREEDRAAVGVAYGALVAANAPALTHLSVGGHLGDGGMRPLFTALRRNTHLRALRCNGNNVSEAFAARVVLPCVRANTSLTRLSIDGRRWPSAARAEALVRARVAE